MRTAGPPPPPDDVGRRQQANAEALAWQSRLRLGVAAVLGAAAVLGPLGGAALAGAPAAVGLAPGVARAALAAVAVGYAAAVLLLRRRARGLAGAWTVGLTFGADLLLLYAATLLAAPPARYERPLIVLVLVLQLVQPFYGRRGALALLGAAVALHLALLATAAGLGAPVAWGAEGGTLALFTACAAGVVLLQGDAARRLKRLRQLFERAEEGDFSGAYDEDGDRLPDSITRVGRAYNRMRTQLATIVLTDPLSGCLNRRGLDQALARELARASRVGAEVAVLAVDVDYFKLINDTFGHLAGDAVIREIGALLRETARAGDVVARVGGEEFMILAPDTNASGAFNLATRIAEGFRRRPFAAVEGRIPVTASIGVVSDRARDENGAEDLRARADQALYAAKRGGRNRVVLWTHGLRDRGGEIDPVAVAARALGK